jgi:hypothetical protein
MSEQSMVNTEMEWGRELSRNFKFSKRTHIYGLEAYNTFLGTTEPG